MSDTNENKTDDAIDPSELTFLCVVDDTPEMASALRFACRRASRSGRKLGLLYVIEPAEFQHWMSVGELMQHERREEAEEMLQVVSRTVQMRTGETPTLYIREGNLTEELMDLIDEDKRIALLVLGAATGNDGPGPLVTTLVQKKAGQLRVPVTVVPGSLSERDIDAIT